MRKMGIVLATGEAGMRRFTDVLGEELGETAAQVERSSVDAALTNALAGEGDREGLVALLAPAVESLERRGCELVAIVGTDAHLVLRELRGTTSVRLLSVVEASWRRIVAARYVRVLLLGTSTTMREKFFKSPIAASHVPVFTPNDEDKEWVDAVIGRVSGGEEPSADDLARFDELVGEAVEHGAQAIVMAAPELLALTRGRELALPVADALGAQAQALVDEARAR